MKNYFILLFSLFPFLLSAQNELTSAFVKYVSINPEDNSITIAWYASPDEVDAVDVKVVEPSSDGNSFTAKHLMTIPGNDESETSFLVSDYVALLGFEYDGPINLMTAVENDSGNKDDAFSLYHKSMFLESSYDFCSQTLSVEWNVYESRSVTISKYRLFEATKDGQKVKEIKSFEPAEALKYEDIVSVEGDYCFFVEVELVDEYGNTQLATSNLTCTNVGDLEKVEYLYANHATVISDNEIEVRFSLSSNVPQILTVVKMGAESGHWEPLTQNPVVDGNYVIYNDIADGIALRHNEYQLSAQNSCGDESGLSNSATNVVLKLKDGAKGETSFEWNKYREWENGIAYIEVYKVLADGNNELVEQISGSETSFTDNSSAGDDENVCYYVKVVEEENNQPYGTSFATSNTVCVEKEPTVWVANTLIPNSEIWKNRTITPVTNYVTAEGYVFKVFDQWGNVAFETDELGKGWNGIYNGQLASQGTYTYLVIYKNDTTEEQEQRGVINIIYHE